MSRVVEKKKKKISPSTVIFVLLLVAGLCVLLYPTFLNIYYNWVAEQEIKAYKEMIANMDYSEYWEAAEAYNERLATVKQFSSEADTEEFTDVSEYLNVYGTGMMGYISIPAIDVEMPIYQGTSEAALQAGAGFWIGTSLPTGGASTHCVLTGHSGLVKAKMFTDLDQLELGDTFTLTILDRVMTYEVDQILTTLPSDYTELKIVDGEDYVTLYTCTPYGVNTHRLLVRGHRIDTPETEEETSGISPLWLLLLIPLIGIIVGIVIWRKRVLAAAAKPAGRRLKS